MKYINHLDDTTIAKLLNRSIGSVQTLRSRGLQRLRNDPRWQRLAVDADIMPGAQASDLQVKSVGVED